MSVKKTIIISALVLTKAKSGYYRVIRNMLLTMSEQAVSSNCHLIFVMQKQAIDLLELNLNDLDENVSIIKTINFKSVWFRGAFEQLAIPVLAIKCKANLIFMPATFGLLFPVRKVITFVHTNTSFMMSNNFRGRSLVQQLVHNILIRITCATSASLLFTTKQTYNEHRNFVKKILPANIIGNGILEPLQNNCNANEIFNYGTDRYILAVSQFYRLKNFNNIILALKEYNSNIKSNNKKISLIIVGTIQEEDFYSELVKLADVCKFVQFKHDISNEELCLLYKNCLFYCSMSLFEGYSLTPAEALMYGKKILLSDIPTHKEVYDGLALFVDPMNIYDIRDGIVKLCDSNQQVDMELVRQRFSQSEFNTRLLKSILEVI